MKKFYSMAALAILGMGMLTSCQDDEDNTVVVDFESDYFTKLIDFPQYGGELLYGEGTDYNWTDEATKLHGELTKAWGGDYGYAEGGIAISNYVNNDVKNHGSYMYQLEVPSSNGSKNFCVVYCDASMSFADKSEHKLASIQVAPTTWFLSVAKYGDKSAKALTGKDDYAKIIMTGLSAASDTTGVVEIFLVKEGRVVEGWNKVNLNALGAVNSVSFKMDSSDKSSWGINTPAYFAFDNVEIYK